MGGSDDMPPFEYDKTIPGGDEDNEHMDCDMPTNGGEYEYIYIYNIMNDYAQYHTIWLWQNYSRRRGG